MDYKNFIDRDKAYQGFVKYRRQIMDASEKGKFDEVFTDIGTRALEGDAIAQDVMAYFYNKGLPKYLKPHYSLYLSWQILSSANGNCFAMEKTEYIIKYALDTIFDSDEVLKQAIINGNINKDNALYVITNLICESMVDMLGINAKKLIDIQGAMKYSPEINRLFTLAMERSVPVVVKYLVS